MSPDWQLRVIPRTNTHTTFHSPLLVLFVCPLVNVLLNLSLLFFLLLFPPFLCNPLSFRPLPSHPPSLPP